MVTFDLDDLQSERSYAQQRAHAQSKHAVQMFGFELDRRLRAANSRVMSVAAHPGVAETNLFKVGDHSPVERTLRSLVGHAIGIVLNTDSEGALPTLYAATAPGAEQALLVGTQSRTRGCGDSRPRLGIPTATGRD